MLVNMLELPSFESIIEGMREKVLRRAQRDGNRQGASDRVFCGRREFGQVYGIIGGAGPMEIPDSVLGILTAENWNENIEV